MRFNITLPIELGRKLKNRPRRSAFIAESLREKFVREEKEKLAKALLEGYKAVAKEDKQINQDWDITAGDGL